MTQTSLALELVQRPTVPSRHDVFGTGITIHCFGKGFPWSSKRHYQNWGEAAPLLIPYLDAYGLSQGVVADLRGMNAYVSGTGTDELVPMHHKPHRLWRTMRMVDSIELEKKRSVFAISADCHTVILLDTLHRRGTVLHCGRDALQPIKRDGNRRAGEASIIDAAMRRLMPTNPREVYALILCGIGPASFENRSTYSEFHKLAVEYFVKTCGAGVVQGPVNEGRLNIPLIVRTQLNRWGVGKDEPERIYWDGIDTYSDDRFHSRRQSPDGNNCVLVDMEKAFE